MSAGSVKDSDRIFARYVYVMRANRVTILTTVLLVAFGSFCIFMALENLRDKNNAAGDVKVTGKNVRVNQADTVKDEPVGLEPDPAIQPNSNEQVTVGNSKIGVSINGTPISIPQSTHTNDGSQTESGDVNVSITSNSSTTNGKDSSSTSISISSSSIQEED